MHESDYLAARQFYCVKFRKDVQEWLIKKIGNNFILSAMDTNEDMGIMKIDSIGYSFRIVYPTVFFVGYDSNVIVANQHPRNFGHPLEKSMPNQNTGIHGKKYRKSTSIFRPADTLEVTCSTWPWKVTFSPELLQSTMKN